MGTDIHMHVEYRFGEHDQWLCGDYFKIRRRSIKNNTFEYELAPLYDKRNYALFSILANERNYAHTDYIDDPRGIPEDASTFVKEDYEDECCFVYGCSYVTLQELIDFHNKKIPLKRSGMISPEAQKNLDLGILPDSWCQGTNMVGWERREWIEENNVLVPLINKLKERADELRLIYEFEWDAERAEARESAYKKSANIRIVFWFDC